MLRDIYGATFAM